MVEYSPASVDRVFRALASAPRRDILRRAAHQRRSVSELAAGFDMSLAAVSKHVQVLADAGLLSLERQGRVHWYSARPDALRLARASLDELTAFWDRRLDALERVVTKTRPSGRRGPGKR